MKNFIVEPKDIKGWYFHLFCIKEKQIKFTIINNFIDNYHNLLYKIKKKSITILIGFLFLLS